MVCPSLTNEFVSDSSLTLCGSADLSIAKSSRDDMDEADRLVHEVELQEAEDQERWREFKRTSLNGASVYREKKLKLEEERTKLEEDRTKAVRFGELFRAAQELRRENPLLSHQDALEEARALMDLV